MWLLRIHRKVIYKSLDFNKLCVLQISLHKITFHFVLKITEISEELFSENLPYRHNFDLVYIFFICKFLKTCRDRLPP